MDAIKLPHAKVREVSEETEDYVSLVLDIDATHTTQQVYFRDIITITKAPPQNGFVEGDYLLLSLAELSEAADSSQHEYNLKIHVLKELPTSLLPYSILARPSHLSLPREDLHIVISTLSGACEAARFYEHIVKPTFSFLGLSTDSYTVHYTLHHTDSDHFIQDLAKNTWGARANQGRHQTIILLSGDGGIVDTINGVTECSKTSSYVKPVVGLLALGTGNAMANSCGLNEGSTKGLSSLLLGLPRPVPTFQAKFSPGSVFLTHEGQREEPLPKDESGHGVLHGAVVASWGLHASLVADSDTTEYRKYGSQRFSMAAKELLAPSDGSKPHSYHGKVTLLRVNDAGQSYNQYWDRDHHSYFLATFVSNLERTLRISPKSQPLDGQLRLVHWGVLSSEEVMQIFGKAFDGGKHIDLESVGYGAIEGLRIDFNEDEGRWRRVCIDGKIVRVDERGWVEVYKEKESAIELIVT